MKIKFFRRSALFLPLLTLALMMLSPAAPATDVRLNGTLSWQLGANRYTAPNGYITVYGRQSYILAKYFRVGSVTGGTIKNADKITSGVMSLDFQCMNYVGAPGGPVLFSSGEYGLAAGQRHIGITQSGYFKSPNKAGYATECLYEFSYDSTRGYYWPRRATRSMGYGIF